MTFQILRCYILLFSCAVLVTIATLMLINQKLFPKIRCIFENHQKLVFWLILVLGFACYMISIIGYMGVEKFVHDFDVFLMWSKMILDDGTKGFLTEYPPLGLYLLAVVQFLLRLVGLGDHYLAASLTMKLPSIMASLAIAYFGYRWAKKEGLGINSLLIMIIIAFNPAFLINASMWGQMDLAMLLFAVLAFYYLREKKMMPAVIFYTIGCMIKPQMIFFAPIFGMFVVLYLWDLDQRIKYLKSLGLGVAISFVMFFLAALPFKESFFDIWIVDFFKHIANEHPVNTASAFNLFGLHGGSFVPDTNAFLFLNYRIWGYIFIAMICAFCAYLSIKNKDKKNIFLLSAFCIAAIYTLGVSMHERYIIPAIALLVLSYIYINKKEVLIFALAYTYLAVINQSIILFDLFGGKIWTFKLWSGISVAIFIAFATYVVFEILRKNKQAKVELDE